MLGACSVPKLQHQDFVFVQFVSERSSETTHMIQTGNCLIVGSLLHRTCTFTGIYQGSSDAVSSDVVKFVCIIHQIAGHILFYIKKD